MTEWILIGAGIVAGIGYLIKSTEVVGVAVIVALVAYLFFAADELDNHPEDKLEMVKEVCGLDADDYVTHCDGSPFEGPNAYRFTII